MGAHCLEGDFHLPALQKQGENLRQRPRGHTGAAGSALHGPRGIAQEHLLIKCTAVLALQVQQ